MEQISRVEQEQATAYFLETVKQLGEAFQKQDPTARAKHLKDMATFFPKYRDEITDLHSALESVTEARSADKGQEELHQNIETGFKEKFNVQDDTVRSLLTDMLYLRIKNAQEKIISGKIGMNEVVQSMMTDARLDRRQLSHMPSGEIFVKVLLTDFVKKSLPIETGEATRPIQQQKKAA
ncbi:hypothetical protein HYV71_00675 [Candidatus Uhrbacteria bacterium]|nr:hypothetical protein [Candidatus Uhrbacteria bacterium]